MRDVEQQDSETSGLLNKQASKTSFVVASNVELPYPSPQVSYVNCMATIALIQMMDPDHDHPIRESCKSEGATVKYTPPVPRDVYRDQNLRKASN